MVRALSIVVLAVGILAVGILAVGILAVGILAVGILAVGILAVGILAGGILAGGVVVVALGMPDHRRRLNGNRRHGERERREEPDKDTNGLHSQPSPYPCRV
jgi:hypothetical protein